MQTILTILLSAFAGIFGGWIGAYLKQKGQNLATKEDIAEITRRQEEIKAQLANRSHFSRLRYEREMAVYQTVWKSLCDFAGLAHQRFAVKREGTSVSSDHSWQAASKTLSEIIRYNSPFYPEEIYKELVQLEVLLLGHSFAELPNSSLSRQVYDMNKTRMDEISKQFRKVEFSIRDRLKKFD